MAVSTKKLGAVETFTLTVPIAIADKEVTELSFRKPTVEELCRIGAIQCFTDSGEATMDYGKLGKYMSCLASVPPSTIKRMEAGDFIACAQWLVSKFFLPSDAIRS